MSTATVRHLHPERADLRDQVNQLQAGQWVRVTWADPERTSSGVVEGTLRRPSNLTDTLFVGHEFCLRVHGHVNITVTKIETEPRPDLDVDELSRLIEDYDAAMRDFEDKPLGHFQTGDNTAEANRVYNAETAIRHYLRGVRL